MTSKEFQSAISKVIHAGLEYTAYPNNVLINVTDVDGTIQSYYASTGTAMFRDGNDRFKTRTHIERKMPLERFIGICRGDEDTLVFFE